MWSGVSSTRSSSLFHALSLARSLARSYVSKFKRIPSFPFSSLHFPQPNPMDEANRFMLGEKRKPSSDDDSSENPHRLPHDFRLSKCRKLDGENDVVYRSRESDPGLTASIPPEKFRARLEICSPDSFTVTPVQAKGFRFPEKQDCLRQLNEILSDVIRRDKIKSNLIDFCEVY